MDDWIVRVFAFLGLGCVLGFIAALVRVATNNDPSWSFWVGVLVAGPIYWWTGTKLGWFGDRR